MCLHRQRVNCLLNIGLIKIGEKRNALDQIHNYLNHKKAKTWTHALEKLMKVHIQLSLELDLFPYIKDGLTAYRQITQSSNISSLEAIFKHYLEITEGLFIKAIQGVEEPSAYLQAIYEADNAEDMFMNCLDPAFDTQRTNVHKFWQLLMDSYADELDLICKNTKLEELYCQVSKRAVDRCFKYGMKENFKLFCEQIRKHQKQNLKNYENYLITGEAAFVLNITQEETNNRLLDMRLFHLEHAKKLELWQDAYKIIEDISVLLKNRKQTPRQILTIYYENVAQIFWHSGLYLFHAVSFHHYYASAARTNKGFINRREVVTKLILASLSIPHEPKELKISREIYRKNCGLLSSGEQIMSRTQLIENMENGMYLEFCEKEVKELFNLMNGRKNILSFAKSAEEIFNKLKLNPIFSQYLDLIEDNLIAQLFERIGSLYKSMSFTTFKKFIGFLDYKKCEKYILYSSAVGRVKVRVDFENDILLFGHEQEISSKISSTLIDYFNSLSVSEKTMNRILMKNNRDWYKMVDKSVIQARNYLETAEEDIQERRDKVKENYENREIEEAKLAANAAKKTEEELERIYQKAKEQRILEAEYKKFQIIKNRLSKIVASKKNATLNGRKLTSYTDAEIQFIEFDDLVAVEKEIRESTRKSEQDRQIKMFRVKDYLARVRREKVCEIIVKESKTDKTDFSQYVDKIISNHKEGLHKRDRFSAAAMYKNKFMRAVMDQRKKKLIEETEAYKTLLKDNFAESIFEKAKLNMEEEKKKQEENAIARKEAEERAVLTGGVAQDQPMGLSRSKLSRGEMQAATVTNPGSTAFGSFGGEGNRDRDQPMTMAARGSGLNQEGKVPVNQLSGRQAEPVKDQGLKRFGFSDEEEEPEKVGRSIAAPTGRGFASSNTATLKSTTAPTKQIGRSIGGTFNQKQEEPKPTGRGIAAPSGMNGKRITTQFGSDKKEEKKAPETQHVNRRKGFG